MNSYRANVKRFLSDAVLAKHKCARPRLRQMSVHELRTVATTAKGGGLAGCTVQQLFDCDDREVCKNSVACSEAERGAILTVGTRSAGQRVQTCWSLLKT
jgi:hypothetical protein